MNDRVRLELGHKRPDSGPIAHIEFVMMKVRMRRAEPFEVPSRVAGRTKKIRAHVVIDTVHFPAFTGEETDNFTADKTA